MHSDRIKHFEKLAPSRFLTLQMVPGREGDEILSCFCGRPVDQHRSCALIEWEGGEEMLCHIPCLMEDDDED